jgi:integrase
VEAGNDDHMALFPNRKGTGPRKDFSAIVTSVTKRLIGVSVTPHAFRYTCFQQQIRTRTALTEHPCIRAAVVTAAYNSGASPRDMHQLARVMGHSTATQARSYLRLSAAQESDRGCAIVHAATSSRAATSRDIVRRQ